MSRLVNTASPGKKRSQARRTIAEMLRRLMLKKEIDEEARDMAALVVISLQEIAETIEVTTAAWEKRDYYLKADRFRLEWEWVRPKAKRIERLIADCRWEELPVELVSLAPRFADIHIAKMTRSASDWKGCHQRLLGDQN